VFDVLEVIHLSLFFVLALELQLSAFFAESTFRERKLVPNFDAAALLVIRDVFVV
jgi:hypothetical protein